MKDFFITNYIVLALLGYGEYASLDNDYKNLVARNTGKVSVPLFENYKVAIGKKVKSIKMVSYLPYCDSIVETIHFLPDGNIDFSQSIKCKDSRIKKDYETTCQNYIYDKNGFLSIETIDASRYDHPIINNYITEINKKRNYIKVKFDTVWYSEYNEYYSYPSKGHELVMALNKKGQIVEYKIKKPIIGGFDRHGFIKYKNNLINDTILYYSIKSSRNYYDSLIYKYLGNKIIEELFLTKHNDIIELSSLKHQYINNEKDSNEIVEKIIDEIGTVIRKIHNYSEGDQKVIIEYVIEPSYVDDVNKGKYNKTLIQNYELNIYSTEYIKYYNGLISEVEYTQSDDSYSEKIKYFYEFY